jgi:hypothetical protein
MIALNTLSFCCMFSILGVIDGSNLGDDLLVEACE